MKWKYLAISIIMFAVLFACLFRFTCEVTSVKGALIIFGLAIPTIVWTVTASVFLAYGLDVLGRKHYGKKKE